MVILGSWCKESEFVLQVLPFLGIVALYISMDNIRLDWYRELFSREGCSTQQLDFVRGAAASETYLMRTKPG